MTNNIFEVYPNPSNGQVTIKLADNINNCHVKIHNIIGELVYSEVIKEQLTIRNLSLKAGLYFLSVDNKGNNATLKIIVE